MNATTQDVSDGFLRQVLAMCEELRCDPLDALGCWMNESGVRGNAQNKGALAAGFFQCMPQTLRGLGFKGDAKYREQPGSYAAAQKALQAARVSANPGAADAASKAMRALDLALSDAFVRIGLDGQVAFAAHYYLPHAGKLSNAAAFYMANFCPAWLDHAGEDDWVICARDGTTHAPMSAKESVIWFTQNSGLDVDGDGRVTPADLGRAIERASQGSRWDELVSRLAALQGGESNA